MKDKTSSRSTQSGRPSKGRKTRPVGQSVEKHVGDPLGLLRPVYPGSTLLPINESLRRLMKVTEKNVLMHVVFNWIHLAEAGVDLDILPPTLAGDTAEKPATPPEPVDDEDTASGNHEKARLDLIEEKRAETYEELRLYYCSFVTTTGSLKRAVVERILQVDWPSGITFAMAAMISFENLRANPLSRTWTAMYLDYGENAQDVEKDVRAAKKRPYEMTTAQQLKDGFSSELENFCSHAMFIDRPTRRLPIRNKMYEALAPLTKDWTRPFVHLRIISCSTTSEICAKAMHILHIPDTPWFLVSGQITGPHGLMGQMSVAALAQSLGALRMRSATRQESMVVSMGHMGELKGQDALALHELIVSSHDVRDSQQMATSHPGGKGRDMRKNDAEDGPLVPADARARVDKTGLYEEIARRERGEVGAIATNVLHEEEGAPMHPAERLWIARQSRYQRNRRRRQVEEAFGREISGKSQANLPRFQQVTYDLHMPFGGQSRIDDGETSGNAAPAIQLKLHGTHVLAGLRVFVERGLDQDKSTSSAKPSSALPSWLIDIRGTRMSVGKGAESAIDQSRADSSIAP